MEWEQRYCPDRVCGKSWSVAPNRYFEDVWLVATAPGEPPWTVAASDPICPHCGAGLVTMVDLEGGLGGAEVIEDGPVLTFLRSL